MWVQKSVEFWKPKAIPCLVFLILHQIVIKEHNNIVPQELNLCPQLEETEPLPLWLPVLVHKPACNDPHWDKNRNGAFRSSSNILISQPLADSVNKVQARFGVVKHMARWVL